MDWQPGPGKLVALRKTTNRPEPVSLIPNVRMIRTPLAAVWALTSPCLQCAQSRDVLSCCVTWAFYLTSLGLRSSHLRNSWCENRLPSVSSLRLDRLRPREPLAFSLCLRSRPLVD